MKHDWDSTIEQENTRVAEAYRRRETGARSQLYSYFNPATLYLVQERERAVLKVLRRRGGELADKTILDVGCGNGFWIREFLQWGAQPRNITGVDLLAARIEIARQLCPADVTFKCENAAALSFSDSSFDIVVQSTVFTSILDPAIREKVASEMLRVLRSAGFILWYDFRFDNPKNPDVVGIKKSEIVRLFPRCRIEFRRITLAPPIGRAVAPISRVLYETLAAMRMLSTHWLACIHKA